MQEQTRARTVEYPVSFVPPASNTLYDAWATYPPWEQTQQGANWYANLPGRYGNAARGSNVASTPSRVAASGGGAGEGNTEPEAPEKYSKPFCDFLTENPTIFHAVKYFEGKLGKAGYEKVCPLPPTLHLLATSRTGANYHLAVGERVLDLQGQGRRKVLPYTQRLQPDRLLRWHRLHLW